MRVDVRGYTVKGSRKYAEAGEGLCEMLRRRASVHNEWRETWRRVLSESGIVGEG